MTASVNSLNANGWLCAMLLTGVRLSVCHIRTSHAGAVSISLNSSSKLLSRPLAASYSSFPELNDFVSIWLNHSQAKC